MRGFGGIPQPKPPPEPEEEPEPLPLKHDTEHERLLYHRTSHFEADCCLPYPLALQLAMVAADWHQVKRAVDAGCTVEQVEAIFL